MSYLYNVVPGDYRTCMTCYATVEVHNEPMHDEWHRELEGRILDLWSEISNLQQFQFGEYK